MRERTCGPEGHELLRHGRGRLTEVNRKVWLDCRENGGENVIETKIEEKNTVTILLDNSIYYVLGTVLSCNMYYLVLRTIL